MANQLWIWLHDRGLFLFIICVELCFFFFQDVIFNVAFIDDCDYVYDYGGSDRNIFYKSWEDLSSVNHQLDCENWDCLWLIQEWIRVNFIGGLLTMFIILLLKLFLFKR